MPNRSAVWWIAVALWGGACTTEPPPAPPVATALAVVTEPSPAGQSGLPLAVQPVVELRDNAGQPVTTRGVLVTAEVASGGGTLSGTTAVRTDADGRARFADLAISGTIGPRTLRFVSQGLTAAVSAPVALAAGPPATLLPSAGLNQTAPAGTPVSVPPAVLVQDGAGNPVAGVAVGFAVTAGGGSVSAAQVASGADGIARLAAWTLGPVAGLNRLTATAGSQQLVFTATGVVGPPARIAIDAGSGQTGVVAQPVPVRPRVKVTDAFDNPVAGVTVTFAVASGGGTVTGPAPVTDALGMAEVGSWVLGLAPGLQTLTASRSPAPAATITATASDLQVGAVAAGTRASCAVGLTGTALCWGLNDVGQLGSGTSGDSASKPRPVQTGLLFQSIAIGAGHACGLTPQGLAYCWGSNFAGQLGNPDPNPATTPVAVTGGMVFTRIAVGDVHTCALDPAGAAWCWGSNAAGRLGDGTGTARAAPTAVVGGHTFTSLVTGSAHSCGIRADGQALCWGSNANGRLGDGSANNQAAPAPVAMPAGVTAFTTITAGGFHTCAVDPAGAAWCWGLGGQGALGTGTTQQQFLPAAVAGGLVFTSVAAGLNHTCGIADAGAVYCWGANGSGRLGDGTTATRTVPTRVARGLTATALAPGDEHTCARTTFGSAVCWGRGLEGQIGDDGRVARLEPTGVTPP